jgi:fatty acid desaturase
MLERLASGKKHLQRRRVGKTKIQGAVMLIIGVAMIIVGSCCAYIDNWIGYLLAFVMAAGVLVTCSTVIMRAIDFAIYS